MRHSRTNVFRDWVGAIVAIGKKELIHSSRRDQFLRAVLITQSIEIGGMAWIDLTVRDLPTVAVDQDRTSESRELLQRIAATHTLKFEYLTTSVEQARGHIRAGRAKAAIIVPPDYGRARSRGGEASILALVDGSDSMSSMQASNAINGVATRMNVDAGLELEGSRVTARSILLFNPRGDTSNYLLPGLLAMILANWYMSSGLSTILREREAGTLDRLLMTPLSASALILGKLIPWVIIGIINGLAYLLVAHYGFGVPMRGSLVLLVITLTMYVLTSVALGAAIAAGARNSSQAFSTVFYVAYPVTWFSGIVYPLASLPTWALPIAYALPQTHFIEIARAICLRGAMERDLLPHLLYLSIAPIFLSALATQRFSRTLMQ
jgi:ABC-2 type transport system permease protein